MTNLINDLLDTPLNEESTDHNTEITTLARDLVRSRSREEIQQQLQGIFGTYDDLDKIEARELPRNPRYILSLTYMADLEYAAVTRDKKDVIDLLTFLRREIKKDESIMKYPLPELEPED